MQKPGKGVGEKGPTFALNIIEIWNYVILGGDRKNRAIKLHTQNISTIFVITGFGYVLYFD